MILIQTDIQYPMETWEVKTLMEGAHREEERNCEYYWNEMGSAFAFSRKGNYIMEGQVW